MPYSNCLISSDIIVRKLNENVYFFSTLSILKWNSKWVSFLFEIDLRFVILYFQSSSHFRYFHVTNSELKLFREKKMFFPCAACFSKRQNVKRIHWIASLMICDEQQQTLHLYFILNSKITSNTNAMTSHFTSAWC